MSEVTLRPMTAAEYAVWRPDAIASYARDMAEAIGDPPDVTLQRANAQFPTLLPDGLDTAGTWLMTILDGAGHTVGAIWIGPHPNNPAWAFVWDIKIAEQHRGRGFGRAAMIAAEQLAASNRSINAQAGNQQHVPRAEQGGSHAGRSAPPLATRGCDRRQQ